jgi:hypothetical protein
LTPRGPAISPELVKSTAYLLDLGRARRPHAAAHRCESSCCSILTFAPEHVDGELVLDISGPADARPVIDLFFMPAAAP